MRMRDTKLAVRRAAALALLGLFRTRVLKGEQLLVVYDQGWVQHGAPSTHTESMGALQHLEQRRE